MSTVTEGQCGLCKHFGENDASPKLVQIRTTHEAPADLTVSYGHPQNEPLNLKVTPLSGCGGYEAAA